MDIGDLNVKNIGKELLENKAISNLVNKFIKELGEYLNNTKEMDNILINNKYSKYWDYQNFIEDNVAANIGLSRTDTQINYYYELNEAIESTLQQISESEGVIYRKQFMADGSIGNQYFNVAKYENGNVTYMEIPEKNFPEKQKNQDVIFKMKDNGEIQIRQDLKRKVIDIASLKAKAIKDKELEKAKDFKEEGHIYEAFEDDEYILLNDLTNTQKSTFEDIDFIADKYQGEGKYQVINGEYTKIE